MSARDQVGWLLKQGFSPGQIARKRNVSEEITLRSLFHLVGEGRIRRSDIYYSLPKIIRNKISSIIEERSKKHLNYSKLYRSLAQSVRLKYKPAYKLDIELAIQFFDSRAVMGDLYDDIRDIELFLNRIIKETLQGIYKNEVDEWWTEGIPKKIQKECASKRIDDDFKKLKDWNYILLKDLLAIIRENWKMFLGKFIKEWKVENEFVKDFNKFNSIRNSVMHPSRNENISEDDFEFIRQFKEKLMPVKKQEFLEPSFIGTESEKLKEIYSFLNKDLDEDRGMHLVDK